MGFGAGIGAVGMGAVVGWAGGSPRSKGQRLLWAGVSLVLLVGALIWGSTAGYWGRGPVDSGRVWPGVLAASVAFGLRWLIDLGLERRAAKSGG